MTREDVIKCAEEYLYRAMMEDKSAKVIFGSDKNNLEGLVERGWKINKFSDVFSYSH